MMAPFQGLPPQQRYWSAATIWLGLTIAVLDGAIANVALPTIARDLAADPAASIWVVNAYQLAIVVALLPLAALGEAVTFRRVFLGGLILFTFASLGCALANSLATLAAARAIQGFGAAGMMSVNGALVRFTYPPRRLGHGVGLNALVASAAAALGPTIAAGILTVAHWPWLFAVNVPLGVVAFAMGRKFLPESPKAGALDRVGAVLNVLTFGPAFVGIDLLTRDGNAWLGSAALVLCVVAGILLVRRARGQAQPIVPVDLLRNRTFTLSVITSIASFAAQMLAYVSLPFYFQSVLHRDQVATGLLMTPWPLAVGLGAPIAGRLADRVPAAILSGAGLVVLATGLACLALLPTQATSFDIIWRMALCGVGFGFFQAPNNRTMLSSAPMTRSGAAGGMLATARLVGQTSGATLAAIAFLLAAANAEHVALTTAAAFAGTAAVISVARLSRPSGGQPSKPGSVDTPR